MGTSLESRLGGVGQIGEYYSLTEHVGFDALFRMTVMDYEIQGQAIPATNGGLSTALHLNF